VCLEIVQKSRLELGTQVALLPGELASNTEDTEQAMEESSHNAR
jgi:hypothetical protein